MDMQSVYRSIDALVDHAKERLALSPKDVDYARNTVLAALGVAFPCTGATADGRGIDELVADFKAAGIETGAFTAEQAESVTDAVLGALTPPPSVVQSMFVFAARAAGPKAATDMLYDMCVDNGYVKRGLLDQNPRFESNGLIITINKAKPEFRDAKKAAAGNSVAGGYPSCSICHQNEGFGGRAKRTLRTVDITLGGQKWFWQYSPYGYFDRHGIAVNYEHTPMHVDRETFGRLMDFVDMFPHFFIGSNAALPRIGGSVLAHDHYQGGGEVLPLHRAAACWTAECGGATIEVLDWKGTAVRVTSHDRNAVTEASERIRAAWVEYDDPERGIIHADAEGIHNAISPTVVKTARGYEMNIILRSNITSERYPDGVFHAHPEFHSIKKESIGLIEAQGLFILPGRLESELGELCDIILAGGELTKELEEHRLVFEETKQRLSSAVRPDMAAVHRAMRDELGSICARILENTAVLDTDHTVELVKKVLL